MITFRLALLGLRSCSPRDAFMGRKQDPADATLRILMLPWLAYGHVSPFLELGKRLSRRGFHVYLCSTPVILSDIHEQLEDVGDGDAEPYPSMELVELHLPTLSGLPPHLHTTKYLPSHLMPILKTAFDLAEPAFCSLLDSLRPNAVIYDFLQPWAATASANRKIPAVLFLPTGAAASAFFCHLQMKPTEEFPSPSIRFDEHELASIRRLLASVSDGVSDGERVTQCTESSTSFVLVKTFPEIEAKYVDYLGLLNGKEHLPVGPLVLEPRRQLKEDPDCRRFAAWLSTKPASSVVFVSFGSEYFMSRTEITEIARGLELSGVNFLWVVRFPKGEEFELEDALPRGFLERVEGRGVVVEGWAPQGAILAHATVGAFATHCGWSSVMEALWWGVPMVTLPMHLDQPLNAKLVVELGVGVGVNRGSSGGGGGEWLYDCEELARVIREVVAGEEYEKVRRKAREMKEVLWRRRDANVDVVAARLAGLCSVDADNVIAGDMATGGMDQ